MLNLFDWRGGYCKGVSSELMSNNELLIAQNCYWDGYLKKRKGHAKYTSFTASGTSIVGWARTYANSAWHSIYARDDGTSVKFYYAATSSLSLISSSYAFTTGNDVEMAELDGNVIFVNGVDKPGLIRYASGWSAQNLEKYDIRSRSKDNWYAGQFDNSGSTTAAQFIDDTTDAQSSAAADYIFAAGASNDGMWVSCDYTFTKVTVYGTNKLSAVTPAYQYYKGSGVWGTCSMATSPTWTSSATSKIIEFNYPSDWVSYDATVAGLSNRYVMRVKFVVPPSATGLASYLAVDHSQYLTQMLADDRPQAIARHNNRIYLALGNNVNVSPYNQIINWRDSDVEYYQDGGKEILSMVSYADQLLIFKENAIYSQYGNSYQTWVKQFKSLHGTIAKKSPVNVGGIVFYVGMDGIRAWNGNASVLVSKHIKPDVDSWTLTSAAGIEYKNNYFISFPTNSIILRTDPDTIREDDMGDGRVSFYKYTGIRADRFWYNSGAGDNGFLLAISNGTGIKYISRLENGTKDFTTTKIDMQFQTRYLDCESVGAVKQYPRIKIKTTDMATATAAVRSAALKFYANDGDASATATYTLPVGTGYNVKDIRIPYTVDGMNLSVFFQQNSTLSAGFIGFSLDSKERYF